MEEGPSPPPPLTTAVEEEATPAQQDEPKSVDKDEPMQVHHPHHYHHQSHSVRASFKRSQQPSTPPRVDAEGGAAGDIRLSMLVKADVLSSASPALQQKKKKEENEGIAETSLTTLPAPALLPPSKKEASSADTGLLSPGPSRTRAKSSSEAVAHAVRLKEPLAEIPPTNGRPTPPPQRGSKACCFCWCCCCSCSWKDTRCLTVKNNEENKAVTVMAAPKDNNVIVDILNGDNSEPPPTIEDIRLWGESFDKLMKCKAGRKVFRDFLRCEYSEENMMFWLACEDIKKESNIETLTEKAQAIYEDYISILSPKEVSLDSRVREITNVNLTQPSCHTFDEAQMQIYTLMHRDSYPRFVNSPMYKKLAQFNTTSRKESSA